MLTLHQYPISLISERCVVSFVSGIMHVSVAMRRWSSTCWRVVRQSFYWLTGSNASIINVRAVLVWCHYNGTEMFCSVIADFLKNVSGAKCEANTFDGERCMYGCLSDSVRRLLKDYKCVSVRAMQRDDFNYFLHMWGSFLYKAVSVAANEHSMASLQFARKPACLYIIQSFMCTRFRLLEQGQHSDVKFLVHGQIFTAHRCVLSARSEYFTDMFESKWKGKNLITLKHPLVDNPYLWTVLWLIDFVLLFDGACLIY